MLLKDQMMFAYGEYREVMDYEKTEIVRLRLLTIDFVIISFGKQ
jgi:hypothetical protein